MNVARVVIGFTVHRFRRLYVVFSAYVLFLAALGHLPIAWIHPVVAGVLCVPFSFGLLITVFGFVNAEADLASPASAYSPWLLRLPIRTWALAFWPILAAALWASTSWILFSAFFLVPRYPVAPVWWPAIMLAALALNMQAILWAPVRHGAVRLVVAMAMPTAIALFGLFAAAYDWKSEGIVAIYALVALISATGAWIGLIRARTSPSSGFRTTPAAALPAEEVVVRHPRRPFRSPRSAQFWLEWRRQGRLLPMLSLFGFLAMSLPLLLSGDTDFIAGSESTKINVWMTTALPILPWIPLLFATAIGMGARQSDVRGSDGVYHLYHATRPLDAADLYKAKVKSIAAGVGLTAVMTIATMLIWLWLPATSTNGTSKPYAKLVFSSFDLRAFAIMTAIGIVLILWTLRNQLVGAFVDYLPHRRFANLYPFAVILSGTTLYILVGESQVYLGRATGVPIVATGLAFALAAKLSAAVMSARKLRAVRPSESREIIRTFFAWAIVAAIFATAFGWIDYELPDNALPPYFHHPVPELLALILVPLARPFFARLALEFGRHR